MAFFPIGYKIEACAAFDSGWQNSVSVFARRGNLLACFCLVHSCFDSVIGPNSQCSLPLVPSAEAASGKGRSQLCGSVGLTSG